ncbi:hypothetical protein GYMLUDRAFT_57945 [Collybiopsis luxurians FD-317 M1]|uniref:Unplaced genomic scaffold GYMLUscaffold_17, whole genome shotgun sequence n=1 Tax=Collybiopsis luxurians FD-317 M1 TaxID=944289 RepID=A0A0D0C514_9AGAR|nr:hypothetical protein GYMLUDRAFT_57945 [Collybiopsis luxurians FD-317 M1]
MPTVSQVSCISGSSESTSESSLSSSLSTSSTFNLSSDSSGEDSDPFSELWLCTPHTELELACLTANYSETTDTDSSDTGSNTLSDTSSGSDPDVDILTRSCN